MKTFGWNQASEMSNGVWAILAFWLSIFLTHHLVMVWRSHHFRWKSFINLPLSMQLAIGMLVVTIAILINQTAVWYARHTNFGVFSEQASSSVIFLVGKTVGIVGLLCILRTVSKPALGNWPWLSALASVGVYLIWWASGFV